MKKVAIMISIILLSGCGSPSANKSSDEGVRFPVIHSEEDFKIIKDEETKCEYIVYTDEFKYSAGGLTPLLKVDGTPNCQ